jgi:CRISPR/Cas system-associated exonuclease Cas4 (RecB family)
MIDMSKNLLKALMEEPKKKAFPVAGLIEKIESGYLEPAIKEQKPKKNFSPSSLAYAAGGGACPRFWHFKFAGEPQINDADAYAVANMKNGTLSHTRIQEAIKNSGLSVASEVKVISNDPPIFGFVDDLISWMEEHIPVEIKTVREEAYQYRVETNKAPVYNLIQLLIYMRLMKKNKGILLYESKNSHALHIIPVEMTPEYDAWLDRAFEWMRTVKKSYDDKQLPMKPYRSNSKVCKKCPFRDVCVSAGKGVVKIPPMESIGA